MLKMLQLVCLTLTGKIRAFMQEEKGAVDIVAIVDNLYNPIYDL